MHVRTFGLTVVSIEHAPDGVLVVPAMVQVRPAVLGRLSVTTTLLAVPLPVFWTFRT